MDDYFSRVRSHNDTRPSNQRNSSRLGSGDPFPPFESNDSLAPNPTIRLRRVPSRLSSYRAQPPPTADTSTNIVDHAPREEDEDNRKRSFSAPQRPSASMLAEARAEQDRRNEAEPRMATLDEESSVGISQPQTHLGPPRPTVKPAKSQGRLRASSSAAWRRLRGGSTSASDSRPGSADPVARREADALAARQSEYDRQVVDLLDVIDPEVSTLTTLNNVQNSLFVPNLGSWFNRTATYNLNLHDDSQTPTDTDMDTDNETAPSVKKEDTQTDERLEEVETPEASSPTDQTSTADAIRMKQLKRSHTLTSVLSASERRHKDGEEHNFAVLPHGVSLDDWTDEDKDELNDHVRHLLHSRKEGFKRSMRGFGKYVRTPFGFFITTYSFLITFWGAAWVLFLIGWISVGDRQAYFVEICDQVLTALFACVGLGMAPFRAVDTYHMIYIAKYHYRTWEERAKRALPDLEDPNDLPEPTAAQVAAAAATRDNDAAKETDAITDGKQKRASSSSTTSSNLSQNPAKAAAVAHGQLPPDQDIVDLEAAIPAVAAQHADAKDNDPNAVLTPRQWALFKHHQQKFQKSHTFYRPHETYTHHAFPIKLLITVVVLLDFHSIFQAALGGTTWGINYHHRPKALTAVILTCSICCNIAGGMTISVGDKKTRKKEVVEQLFRQEITKQAMRRLNRKKGLKIPKEAMKPTKEEVKDAKKKDKAKKSLDKHRKEVKKLDEDGQFGDKRGDLDEGAGGYIART